VNIGSGTFHPKAYYFQSGDKAAAIVGSANFTKAGTTDNVEAALLLEGSAADAPLQSIRAMIESLWDQGNRIDDEFLSSYRLRYAASRRYREALSKPLRVNRPKKDATHPDLLKKSWRSYVSSVKSSQHHNLDGRLRMLRKAQSLLNSADSFSGLTVEQRKAIAGVVGRKEILGNDLDNYKWGWFGSMFGAGTFKNRIAENDRHLSAALECIPPMGEVTSDDYFAFIEEFIKAFKKSDRKGGLPPATRLLAMKRPDYFVCVDSKNLRKMSGVFGFARTTLNFEKYWSDIVETIIQAKWWQARRPAGTDGRIWDGRAAMLDAIYYEPV